MTTSAEPTFKDTSVDCAICLSSLDGGDGDGGGGGLEEVIELSCGHRWHLHCVTEQLRHARPSNGGNGGRRLLFSGCRCAKCGSFCDHDALRHLTRATDVLRDRVDVMVEEQVRMDAPEAWRDASSPKARAALVEEGRRRYAFYLCSSCEEPYFGGTVECADDVDDGEGGGGDGPSVERLCPTCSPAQTRATCTNPAVHRGHHVWKCRYCCRPSSHVCYGSVHFCDGCHERNSERLRVRRRAAAAAARHHSSSRRRGRGGGDGDDGDDGPPPLEAIPCVGEGGGCRYPMPTGHDRHSNGPTPDCEQVYRCAWCVSVPSSQSSSGGDDHPTEEPGSRNFIVNPSGSLGLRGWRQLNPRMSWRVERSEVPRAARARALDGVGDDAATSSFSSTNFVSGFAWCVMAQVVPLHSLVNDPSSVRVEVSALFMGRTDCPSVFRMEALVRNRRSAELHRVGTAQLVAPADFWERTSLVVGPVDGAHDVVMIVYGKDTRFWRGDFGSKVAECSVRVLCPESELDDVLRPDATDRMAEERGGRHITHLLWAHGWNLFLPLAVILLAWMHASSGQ